MNDFKKPSNELSQGKAIAGCFLAVTLLILAQSLALFISLPLPALGLPGAVCNVVAGLLYAAFALTGAVLLAARFLRLSPAGLRCPDCICSYSNNKGGAFAPSLLFFPVFFISRHLQRVFAFFTVRPGSRTALPPVRIPYMSMISENRRNFVAAATERDIK